MSTSDLIKEALARNRVATTEQLSRELDLTKADIHYQVRQLLKSGEICVLPVKYQSGPGRPARQFELVQAAPTSIIKLIVSLLLSENVPKQPIGSQSVDLSDKIARRILSCCPSAPGFTYSPAVKLIRLIEELAIMGFILRWEAGKQGPIIHIDREPLSVFIEDQTLVRKILNALIIQIKKETA